MIPASISLLVLAGASFLAGWLKDMSLPMWANGALDLAAFLLAATIIVMVNGGFTGDVSTNLTLFLGACAGIYALLFPIQSHVVSALRSPLVRRVRLVRRVHGRPMASSAVTPPAVRRASLLTEEPESEEERRYDDTMPLKAMPLPLPSKPPTVIPADPQLKRRRPLRAEGPTMGIEGADTAEVAAIDTAEATPEDPAQVHEEEA